MIHCISTCDVFSLHDPKTWAVSMRQCMSSLVCIFKRRRKTTVRSIPNEGWTKLCSDGSGSLTKMTCTQIWDNPLKAFAEKSKWISESTQERSIEYSKQTFGRSMEGQTYCSSAIVHIFNRHISYKAPWSISNTFHMKSLNERDRKVWSVGYDPLINLKMASVAIYKTNKQRKKMAPSPKLRYRNSYCVYHLFITI